MRINEFIENEMRTSPIAYSIIYLYILSEWQNNKTVTVQSISENIINLTEIDIRNSLNFWRDKNYLGFNQDNIYPYKSVEANEIEISKTNEINKTHEHKNETTKVSTIVVDHKPTYSMEELELFKKDNSDVNKIFQIAESTFGKYLSSNDLNTMFSFYDWLRLPVDVIEMLVVHCASNGHNSIHYMEKVAVDWHDKNLNTIEKVNDHLKMYNKEFREILKSLGVYSRDLTAIEIEFIEKWRNEYNFSHELILEACDKTILTAQKPSLAYVDGIIKNWLNAGVKTKEDAVAYEEKHYATINNVKEEKKKKVTKNKFSNFTQESIDFSEIEKLENERLKRKIKE
ncbi:MAG: DnaD domain protein [Lachnospirales bacterium]